MKENVCFKKKVPKSHVASPNCAGKFSLFYPTTTVLGWQ